MPKAAKAPWSVQLSSTVPLARGAAFTTVVDELREALGRLGLQFEPGPRGSVTEGGVTVGRVEAWEPKERIRLAWHPAPWDPTSETVVEIQFTDSKPGTRITLEHQGGEKLFGGPDEVTGWFSSGVLAPFLAGVAPVRLGDWVTDRAARRPFGKQARVTYSDPQYHRPNFLLLLENLDLSPRDRLLEVGCGGGAFLKEALKSGCRVTAVDHSPEMVRLAQLNNREAVAEGRAEILEGDAAKLPVPDESFTCAVSTGVFGFLPDPEETLREIRRALMVGGRLVVYSGTRELIGTPACPEPVASRLHFYEDDEMERMAHAAGFRDAEVRHPDLERYAVEARLPANVVAFFRGGGSGGFLLVAQKRGP
ncbi:MAG TPA: methyltransferase domain-containing protein [Thermoplasmata archaeon]|nr:methyltransferase domain-containing protein [Thermoplasmata archaeon]